MNFHISYKNYWGSQYLITDFPNVQASCPDIVWTVIYVIGVIIVIHYVMLLDVYFTLD